MTASKTAGLSAGSTNRKSDAGRTTWDTVEIVATSVVRPVIVTAAVFARSWALSLRRMRTRPATQWLRYSTASESVTTARSAVPLPRWANPSAPCWSSLAAVWRAGRLRSVVTVVWKHPWPASWRRWRSSRSARGGSTRSPTAICRSRFPAPAGLDCHSVYLARRRLGCRSVCPGHRPRARFPGFDRARRIGGQSNRATSGSCASSPGRAATVSRSRPPPYPVRPPLAPITR